VQRALGSTLIHAVRGSDGESVLVLHRALPGARAADRSALAADILRELAFADVRAAGTPPPTGCFARPGSTLVVILPC
jgi:hypothetical protein